MKVSVKKSKLHGRGVFATKNIREGEVIEVCPVIVLGRKDTKMADDMVLRNYYFTWVQGKSAIVLGFGSIYNHSKSPNAQWDRDVKKMTITFEALKPIKKGEEITHNYNGHPNSQKKVWFEK